MTAPILKAIDNDHRHTVFSFIPNTAEVAFYGMLTGFKNYINAQKVETIVNMDHKPTREELMEILDEYVRSEKVAWKDIKLRTFISEGSTRNDLASHVYDVTYNVLEPGVDNLVVRRSVIQTITVSTWQSWRSSVYSELQYSCSRIGTRQAL